MAVRRESLTRRSASSKEATGRDRSDPKPTKGERTRARLLEAAEACFGEGTYDAASIVDITRRAGVSQGTFYLYFHSKIDIFREVVRSLSHEVRRSIAEAVTGAASRSEVERRGFDAFFHFVQEHPNLYRIIRQAEFVDRDVYREHYERLADGYVRGLRAAMDEGEFRRLDPEVVAYALMGMGEMLGARWLLWDEPGAKRASRVPKKVGDTVGEFILKGLKA